MDKFLDWQTLSRIDTIFGVIAGIVMVYTFAKWIGRRLTALASFLPYALTGESDYDRSISILRRVAKWLGACAIWALMGGLIGVVSFGLTSGLFLGSISWLLVGAAMGAIFRGILVPSGLAMFRSFASATLRSQKRRADFDRQRDRVEREIERRRH